MAAVPALLAARATGHERAAAGCGPGHPARTRHRRHPPAGQAPDHLAARDAGPDLVRDILAFIEQEHLPVNFPLEVRTTAADDAFLSPAYERDSVYVAVHNFVGMPTDAYFAGVWELGRRHGARPHWGKRHPATASDLSR